MATGDGSRLLGATLAPPTRASGQEGTRFSDQGYVSQQLNDFRGRRELVGGRELLVRHPTNSIEQGTHLAHSVLPACRVRHRPVCPLRIRIQRWELSRWVLHEPPARHRPKAMISERMVRRLPSISRFTRSRSSGSIMKVRGTRIFGRMAPIALASAS